MNKEGWFSIGGAGFIVAVVGLLFGDNLIEKLRGANSPSQQISDDSSVDRRLDLQNEQVVEPKAPLVRDANSATSKASTDASDTAPVVKSSELPINAGKPYLPIKIQIISANITQGSSQPGYGVALRLRLTGAPVLIRPFITNGNSDLNPIHASATTGNDCRFLKREGGIPYIDGSDPEVMQIGPSLPEIDVGKSVEFTLFADCRHPIFSGTKFAITGHIFYFVDDWTTKYSLPWRNIIYSFSEVILQ